VGWLHDRGRACADLVRFLENEGQARKRPSFYYCSSRRDLPSNDLAGALGILFLSILAISLPALLQPIKSRMAVWIAFVLSTFPILRDWDARGWPTDVEYARRVERRNESVQLRDLALTLQSAEARAFFAPWWLSPSIAYWSRQPAVAGSSHESLPGIEASARFFLSEDWQTARKILDGRRVSWVITYDFERLARNSAALLGSALPQRPLCFVLDRTPAQAPWFLILSVQNATAKLYRTTADR
jgi:hypothetical protein